MDDLLTPDFNAQLTYLTEAEGGRNTPLGNGHRTRIVFQHLSDEGIAEHQFEAQDLVFPGDVLEAQLSLVVNDDFQSALQRGDDFDFFEGDRKIGSGVITSILNSDLEA